LHKQPPKLRYITPVVDWINRGIAEYVVRFLNPYVKRVPWILESSSDLLRLLESSVNGRQITVHYRSLWLGSFDISDMYNQIDQEESLKFIWEFAWSEGWIDQSNEPDWRLVMDLTHWVYDCSFVTYQNRYFLQKRGLPMGSPLSPVIANLFMAALERKAINEFINMKIAYGSLFIYRRYLDDIFICSAMENPRIADSEGCNPLEEDAGAVVALVMQAASSSNILFEMTGDAWRDGESIEYLDLRLGVYNRNKRKRIRTSVFDKPTNLHIYTDPSTWFPFHYIYNWIQGENIRLIRNSSEPEAYLSSLELFKQFLFRRGYCASLVNTQLQFNTFADRNALLRGEKPQLARKGKGKNKRHNTYITIENSGIRDVVTKQVKLIDFVSSEFDKNLLTFIPVVKKGKTVMTVMNKTRKN
jgi:hypothetical protein